MSNNVLSRDQAIYSFAAANSSIESVTSTYTKKGSQQRLAVFSEGVVSLKHIITSLNSRINIHVEPFMRTDSKFFNMQ